MHLTPEQQSILDRIDRMAANGRLIAMYERTLIYIEIASEATECHVADMRDFNIPRIHVAIEKVDYIAEVLEAFITKERGTK